MHSVAAISTIKRKFGIYYTKNFYSSSQNYMNQTKEFTIYFFMNHYVSVTRNWKKIEIRHWFNNR